jgi:uncharacterized protein (DUF1778 family)
VDPVTRHPKRRKTRAERKEDFLRIRVTAEQKVLFESAARRQTLDVSAWVRQVLLRAAGWDPDARQ